MNRYVSFLIAAVMVASVSGCSLEAPGPEDVDQQSEELLLGRIVAIDPGTATVASPVTITSVNSGLPAATYQIITINGTNFNSMTNILGRRYMVEFTAGFGGFTVAPLTTTDTQITVQVPFYATSGKVRLLDWNTRYKWAESPTALLVWGTLYRGDGGL